MLHRGSELHKRNPALLALGHPVERVIPGTA